MSKTSVFTTITPLPSGITRQSVMETYLNHIEMIELNPLVVERYRCKPPSYAPAEEYHSTWYTIKDKVSYLPGGLASGSVSYHACFHNLPDGLQTHVYAPLGLDIRAKWSVGGNLPGEPRQPVELGLGIPHEGLYIREDVRMKCNIMMLSFVKKTFKDSHAKLVDRLVEKAHVIEAKIANERLHSLRTVDPGDRMGHGDIFIAPPPGYQPLPGHMSIYSSGSGHSPLNSPGLSQSSTLGVQSPNPLSPPYRPGHLRVPSNATQEPNTSELFLPEFLSDVKFGARNRYSELPGEAMVPAPLFHAYRQDPVELCSEPPPVPPKDTIKFAVELPS